jgi:HEAT repeat protein
VAPARSQQPALPDERTAKWLRELQGGDESTRLAALYGLYKAHPDAKAAVKALAGVVAGHEDPGVRRVAVMALGELASESDAIVPVLMGALRDKDVAVARQAAVALAKLGAPAVPALAAALPDLSPIADPTRIGKDGQSRALFSDYAAWTLSKVDAPVVPALARVFKEVAGRKPKDPRPHAGASTSVELLWAIENRQTPELTPAYLAREIVLVVKERGRRDVPDLVTLLGGGDEELQSLALGALNSIGPAAAAAAPAVVKVTADGNRKSSLAAVATLGRIGASGPLVELLRTHPADAVRAAAAKSLTNASGAAITALMDGMLKDGNAAVRAAAAGALGESLRHSRRGSLRFSRTPRVAPPPERARAPHASEAALALGKALRDSDATVRQAASRAIEEIVVPPLTGGKEAVPALTELLRVPEAPVQRAAATLLGAIGGEANAAVPTLIGGLKTPPEFALGTEQFQTSVEDFFVRALGRIAAGVPEARAILLDILRNDKRQALHTAAMESLGQLGAEGAVPVLVNRLEALYGDSARNWSPAADALLRIRPRGVAALTTILNDRSRYKDYRERASEALANASQSDASITQALRGTLGDSDATVRRWSALGLARRGVALEESLPVLADALSRARNGEWREPLDALSSLRNKGVPVLLGVLASDRGVKERTAILGDLKALYSKDPRVAPAIDLLGRLGNEDAALRVAVIEHLAEAGVADAAVEAALLQALRDTSPAVREAAATALGTLRPDKPAAAIRALVALLKDESGPGANFSRTVRETEGGSVSVSRRPVPALSALESLGRYGPNAAEAVPELTVLLTRHDPVARRSALAALAGIGPGASEAEAAVRSALRDRDSSVRVAASGALLKIIKDPSTAGPEATDVTVREYVDRSLKRFLDPLADALRPSVLVSGYFPGGLPPFPWPPPRYTHKATAGLDFPREILGNDDTTLGAIYTKLFRALRNVDPNFESGLFAAPGGFVMLARLERVNADGTPLPGDLHWVYGTLPPQSFSDYLGRLFFEKPGYFREVAFVVTSENNFGYGSESLPDLQSGGTELPDDLAQSPFKGKSFYALIYSMERHSGGGLSPFDTLSAIIHLEKSGLLTAIANSQ